MIAKAEQFDFDEDAADRACEFFEHYLIHVKGELAGKPLLLSDWQRNRIIRPLFGWKRKDGTRRYRTAYIEVPRKNGKSTLVAGLALYLLSADQEAGAEIYSAAADRFQASIVFDIARQMSDANKVLSAMCQHYRVSKTLLIEETGSKYVALSSEVPTKHGLNASGIIFDELHAQPNRDLWDVLSTSVGSRKQPMTVAITTAGHDRNSICREQYEYAIKVRDGIINDSSFLTVIYEAADDDDWTSPEVWAKANPNLGISIKLEYLEQKCKEAQESPAKENTFKRLHLNIWTEQDVRWLSMARWDACIGDTNIDDLAGEKCFAGLDMASTTDIAALVLYFPHTDSLLPFFWIPRENAHARERRDRVPYLQWAQSEHIRMTDGNVIDYDVIRKDIVELGERYNICDIAIDRWNSTQLQNQLDGDGFNVVQFGQGYASMSAPTKELERLILQGALQHSGNPVLRWMASNVSVEIDAADNMKPSKKKSTEKIDGVVAAIMAIGRAMTATDSTSVYAEHGIQVIRA